MKVLEIFSLSSIAMNFTSLVLLNAAMMRSEEQFLALKASKGVSFLTQKIE